MKHSIKGDKGTLLLRKWRSWSPALKGLVTGAMLGIFMTVFCEGIFLPFITHASPESELLQTIVYLSPIVPILLEFPTALVFAGSHWPGSHRMAFAFLAILINTAGYAIFGCGIAYVASLIRAKRNQRRV